MGPIVLLPDLAHGHLRVRLIDQGGDDRHLNRAPGRAVRLFPILDTFRHTFLETKLLPHRLKPGVHKGQQSFSGDDTHLCIALQLLPGARHSLGLRQQIDGIRPVRLTGAQLKTLLRVPALLGTDPEIPHAGDGIVLPVYLSARKLQPLPQGEIGDKDICLQKIYVPKAFVKDA